MNFNELSINSSFEDLKSATEIDLILSLNNELSINEKENLKLLKEELIKRFNEKMSQNALSNKDKYLAMAKDVLNIHQKPILKLIQGGKS